MRWRRGAGPLALALAMLASGCTVTLAQPGLTVTCGPIHVGINPHDVGLGGVQRTAIVAAVDEFGDLVGRAVVFDGDTSAVSGEHRVGDPLLIELAWPDDAPDHLGFAQPVVAEGRYVEGWIMLHPGVARAPAGVVRRLVLHELGHLYGLADVDDPDELMDPDLTTDDFGLGDLIGLYATHEGGCGTGGELRARVASGIQAFRARAAAIP